MKFYVRSFLGVGLFFFAWAAFEYSIYQFLQIGTCASGGPYISARQCPSGTGIYFAGLFGGIILGLIAVGIYATRGTPPGVSEGDYQSPRVSFGILAWSLLFLGTGIIGIIAVLHGNPGPGAKTGAIIVAAVFIPMGAIPLLASLRRGPTSKSPPVRLRPPPAAAGGAGFGGGAYSPPGGEGSPLGWVSAPAPPAPPSVPTGIGVHRPNTPASAAAPPSAPAPAATQHKDGLGQLEKLKKLRDEGTLSDAEFQAAKAKILGEL
jgi:hypothetical protein